MPIEDATSTHSDGGDDTTMLVTVGVITACTNSLGMTELVLTIHQLTKAQADEGDQADLAEEALEDADYEEPFLHFHQEEMSPERWAAMVALAYTISNRPSGETSATSPSN